MSMNTNGYSCEEFWRKLSLKGLVLSDNANSLCCQDWRRKLSVLWAVFKTALGGVISWSDGLIPRLQMAGRSIRLFIHGSTDRSEVASLPTIPHSHGRCCCWAKHSWGGCRSGMEVKNGSQHVSGWLFGKSQGGEGMGMEFWCNCAAVLLPLFVLHYNMKRVCHSLGLLTDNYLFL